MRPPKNMKKTEVCEKMERLGVCEFGDAAKEMHADVQGSYTGNPLYDEEPVQDVDDL